MDMFGSLDPEKRNWGNNDEKNQLLRCKYLTYQFLFQQPFSLNQT